MTRFQNSRCNAKWFHVFFGTRSGDQLSHSASVCHVVPEMVRRFAAAGRCALGKLELHVNVSPKLYSEIITDRRISHGAFRLWHFLRDRHGNNQCCWPSLKTICSCIGCGKAALLGWITELRDAGYITTESGNKTRSNRYFVRGSTQNHAEVLSNTTCGSKQIPIGGSKPSHELNSVELNKKNGGAHRLFPKEINIIIAEIDSRIEQHWETMITHGIPAAKKEELRGIIKGLKVRRLELKDQLIAS